MMEPDDSSFKRDIFRSVKALSSDNGRAIIPAPLLLKLTLQLLTPGVLI
jgi:hypothetical protein